MKNGMDMESEAKVSYPKTVHQETGYREEGYRKTEYQEAEQPGTVYLVGDGPGSDSGRGENSL